MLSQRARFGLATFLAIPTVVACSGTNEVPESTSSAILGGSKPAVAVSIDADNVVTVTGTGFNPHTEVTIYEVYQDLEDAGGALAPGSVFNNLATTTTGNPVFFNGVNLGAGFTLQAKALLPKFCLGHADAWFSAARTDDVEVSLTCPPIHL
jgi:hypothetical protein